MDDAPGAEQYTACIAGLSGPDPTVHTGYVPGTVLGPENRAVSKTDLHLALMDLHFRGSQTKNEDLQKPIHINWENSYGLRGQNRISPLTGTPSRGGREEILRKQHLS